MKNYKQIKANIKKWYKAQRKRAKNEPIFSPKNGVRIDNPTPRERAAELRRIDKQEAAKLAELDRIAAAEPVRVISIRTEWIKSRMWGYNPHTTAAVFTDKGATRYFGRASGCGYDKHSAAITDALYNCESLKRLIIENYRKLKKEFPSNGCYIHFDNLPNLATSGSGVTSLKRVLEVCGLKCVNEYYGKKEDFLEFSSRK